MQWLNSVLVLGRGGNLLYDELHSWTLHYDERAVCFPELISLFEIAKVLAYPAPSAMKSADSGLKYL